MCAQVSESDDSSYNRCLGGLQATDDRETFGLQVGELLYGIHMHAYIPVFREHNIGIDLFLALNEDDLRVMGVEERDIEPITTLIKCLQRKSKAAHSEKDSHLAVEPEPKMSMRDVLAMQCHTAKQLIRIRKMVTVIENKLKEDKFSNTLVDTDYCAAHALKIVCTELVRQADILYEESKNLNDTLQRIVHQDKVHKIQRRNAYRYLWTGVFIASLAPMAIIVWRSLRK